MSWFDFYSIANLADGFGSTKNRANPHRGLDVPRGGGTDIPAWRPGKVVANQWSSVLGWVVVIQAGASKYDGYCHMEEKSPLKIGSMIGLGDYVGDVGNTGSASKGNHLHMTTGPWPTSVFHGEARDPWPELKAAIASAKTSTSGGGSSTPVNNTPLAPPKRQNGSGNMAQYARNSDTGEVARLAESVVTVFGSRLDYVQHRETISALINGDPTGQNQKAHAAGMLVYPPDFDNPKNFVNLDQAHWDLELAVRKGNR